MKQQTVKVSNETNKRIIRAKYSMDCKTADETINKVFDIAELMEAKK